MSIDLASSVKAKAPAGLSRVIHPTAKAQLKGRLERFQGETGKKIVLSNPLGVIGTETDKSRDQTNRGYKKRNRNRNNLCSYSFLIKGTQ